ncbi:MAG: hypothetical protein V4506_14100 [Bacteroidota bacterium]
MDSTGNNREKDSVNNIVDKDVLGLDKNQGNTLSSNAKPKRIFIALAIIAVIVIIYWFSTQ